MEGGGTVNWSLTRISQCDKYCEYKPIFNIKKHLEYKAE